MNDNPEKFMRIALEEAKESLKEGNNVLIKQLSGRLEFRRNYEKLRPYGEYCEEMILLEDESSILD
jgi:hypothetical protein